MNRKRSVYLFNTKELLLFSMIVFVGITIISATAYTAISVITEYVSLEPSNKVVLDAGHGGVDGGAIFSDIKEKDITLDVVLLTRYYLVQRGIYVEFTRDTDRDVSGWDKYQKGRHRKDLQERARILDGGSVGVSIHVNTSASANEKGAMAFYARGSEQGEMLASRILAELEKVQSLNHPKPIPRSNLYLLANTQVPVVLVELGFISNAEDRANLLDADRREEMAMAIATGIIKYLDEFMNETL